MSDRGRGREGKARDRKKDSNTTETRSTKKNERTTGQEKKTKKGKKENNKTKEKRVKLNKKEKNDGTTKNDENTNKTRRQADDSVGWSAVRGKRGATMLFEGREEGEQI